MLAWLERWLVSKRHLDVLSESRTVQIFVFISTGQYITLQFSADESNDLTKSFHQ